MRRAARFGLAVAATLLLAACFLLPGKFASTLDVKRDGQFSFAYKGEIVLVTPAGSGVSRTAIKDDPAALCYGPIWAGPGSKLRPQGGPTMIETVPIGTPQRECTQAEREQRSANIAKANAANIEARKREGEQLAKIIGMDPSDGASMRDYAAQVSKQAGWRSIVYRGNGVFDVDFAQSGRLDRDFVFPVLPRASVIVPFVVVRKRSDSAVMVSAPAYRAAPAQAFLNGINNTAASPAAPAPGGPSGTFVVTSDLAPLTNNTDDGPARDGTRTRLSWTVAPSSDKVPEALLPVER